MAQFQPVVLSGPSGSGKSTLLTRLMKEFNGCFAFSVSHTTRQPRPGEQDGREYHFVDRSTMEKKISNGDFLEHAQFSGNLYGTSKQAVEDVIKTGKICVLDVEMQGVKNVKKTSLNARFIFIKPPSMDILEERLRGRGTESEESLVRRLDEAKGAVQYAEEKDAYDHIVVNDQLDVAYETFKGLFIKDIHQLQQQQQGQPH